MQVWWPLSGKTVSLSRSSSRKQQKKQGQRPKLQHTQNFHRLTSSSQCSFTKTKFEKVRRRCIDKPNRCFSPFVFGKRNFLCHHNLGWRLGQGKWSTPSEKAMKTELTTGVKFCLTYFCVWQVVCGLVKAESPLFHFIPDSCRNPTQKLIDDFLLTTDTSFYLYLQFVSSFGTEALVLPYLIVRVFSMANHHSIHQHSKVRSSHQRIFLIRIGFLRR